MSQAPITREVLEHLASLARIQLTPEEEEKFLKDLQSILDYFKELQEVNTEHVEPLSGGTLLTNVFREDEERRNTLRGQGSKDFPLHDNSYLMIPPVFKEE
jgi:aspartyl-tRNA(Asn)/glutamyl-tRNA(Gln) amidotransferase subunit C